MSVRPLNNPLILPPFPAASLLISTLPCEVKAAEAAEIEAAMAKVTIERHVYMYAFSQRK